MELYIPPPMPMPPRPPPRPTAPPVPYVNPPPLPETIEAPEGAYKLNNHLFPEPGRPSTHNANFSMIPQQQSVASAMLSPVGSPIPIVSVMNFAATYQGCSTVNGESYPPQPVKYSWASVTFPSQVGQKQRAFLGMGGGGGGKNGDVPTSPPIENSMEDDDSDDSSDQLPPVAYDVPLSALPQQNPAKRNLLGKSTTTTSLPRPQSSTRASNAFAMHSKQADNFSKVVADRGKNGAETVRLGFWNMGKTVSWGEEGPRGRTTVEGLTKIVLHVAPTCHAILPNTVGPDRQDAIIGCDTGDLIWLDLVTAKYTRLNAGGQYNKSAVVNVQFDPRKPQYFLAAFADGMIIQFNLFAKDWPDKSHTGTWPWASLLEPVMEANKKRPRRGVPDANEKMVIWKNADFGVYGDPKKKNEWPAWSDKNPSMAFRVGTNKINDFAFSPDGSMLAIVSEEGQLRLIDTVEQRLTDTYQCYYASLNCIAWSHDSRFVAVGGKDDLITIISPREGRVIARCEGHSNFVTSIAFDPWRRGGYHFASVGEDAKLLLWDFSPALLHRPRHHNSNAAGSTLSVDNPQSAGQDGSSGSRYHPTPLRGHISILEPVLAQQVDSAPLTGVYFSPQAIYTVSRSGNLKPWQRPPRQKAVKRGTKVGTPFKPEVLRGAREREVAVAA